METVQLDREIFQTRAPTGVIVLSERVPSVRSAAVGIWVRSASAHEARPKMGVSHLLEHMVFKGTERRSAQDIALALESRGGSLDAYTSRDTTAFQARVLDSDLPRALDVLTDLVRNPVLRSSDLELERNVVLEEINTVEDTPDDQVFDLSYQTLWPKHSYGYSILGTRDTVSALSTDDLKQLHGRAYFPANCVIAAAGNLTHEGLLEQLAKQGWFEGERTTRQPASPYPRQSAAPRPATPRTPRRPTSCSRPTRYPTPTGASTRCWCSATCSAAGCRAGCSSGFARSWASRTPSTRSRASTAKRASPACTSGRNPRPRRRPRRPSARSTRSWRARGSATRRSRRRNSKRRASWCSRWRVPLPGCIVWRVFRSTASRTKASTRCSRRSPG